MVVPLKSWFTVFNAINATTTARIPALGALLPEFANSIILEVVGASTPSWTLDIQGRTHPDGTFVAWDYIQWAQAGAAALTNAQLSITDTTRRFYVIPTVPGEMQLIATLTTGTLTVRGSYTSAIFTQWLRTTARGSIFAEGPVAHDGVAAGNAIPIGGVASSAVPTAVSIADQVNAFFDLNGRLVIAFGVGGSGDAITATSTIVKSEDTATVRAFGTMPYAVAPDASADRLRTVGDTAALGLGVLATSHRTPGASEVKSVVVDVAATSVTRQTLITPTTGKKVRITSVQVVSNALTTAPGSVGVYFGTGAAYTTTVANAIAEFVPGTTGEQGIVFPDGGGPLGAADAVVSGITATETETAMRYTIQYREE